MGILKNYVTAWWDQGFIIVVLYISIILFLIINVKIICT